MALAAKSWGPDRSGEYHGGGTVWERFSCDARLDLLFFNAASATPYLQKNRRPTKSDDLFSASITAVHESRGSMAWVYQEMPGDQWEYGAIQKCILADLSFAGMSRKLLMQVSRNGSFYVLDRSTRLLLSAHAYTHVNWATSVIPKTARPPLTSMADYAHAPKNIYPSWAG